MGHGKVLVYWTLAKSDGNHESSDSRVFDAGFANNAVKQDSGHRNDIGLQTYLRSEKRQKRRSQHCAIETFNHTACL